MTQHTPGPWKSGPVFQKEGRALFITDTSKPGKWQRRLDDKSGVFAEADAALIASAPSLLAACEKLAAWDQSILAAASTGLLSEACSLARAAIAQAKGE